VVIKSKELLVELTDLVWTDLVKGFVGLVKLLGESDLTVEKNVDVRALLEHYFHEIFLFPSVSLCQFGSKERRSRKEEEGRVIEEVKSG